MILTTLYLVSSKTPIVGTLGRGICSVLFSSCSDGFIIYINSPSPLATCVFIRHQVRSRRRPTALITWISHPAGPGSSTRFGGMTHSVSPSLHNILEESPSKDNLALSEGESYGSPLLRACNTVIPVRACTLTLPTEVTLVCQAVAARPQ
jgi:hypothetical protein